MRSGGDACRRTRSMPPTPPARRATAAKEMKTWDKKQLREFLESVADDQLCALWYTIAFTGMRRGEALGLRWSDVDLENARLSVRQALIPIDREVVVSEPKTAKGRRVVALDPSTIEVLKAQAARQLDEQDEWEDAWIDQGSCSRPRTAAPSTRRPFRVTGARR